MNQIPTVGRAVHVINRNLDERWSSKHMAGIITDVSEAMMTVQVLHPMGPLHNFNAELPTQENAWGMDGCTWHWPERA